MNGRNVKMNLREQFANIIGDSEVMQGRPRPDLPVDRLVEVDVAKQNHSAGYNAALADVYEALTPTAARALRIMKGE
jgi:hypothetical protein